jgi:repressor LexA
MQEVRPLTKRQKQALDYITKYLQDKGYSPALKEVAKFLGTENLSTAQYFIDQLTQKGYLKRESYKNRGISPVISGRSIQLLGYIAAGEPIEPIENPESITIPTNIIIDNQFPHYALKVKGDSMIDMGIIDGDTILVRHQLAANNGDVVVAITEKGATLKVLRINNNQKFLEARNKNFPNIYPKKLEIRGKFVGLIRT